MRYRVLVNVTNLSLAKEFIGYSGNYFDCLGTTDLIADLERHCKLFLPHALFCFVDRLYDGLIESLQWLKDSKEYGETVVIFVTKSEIVEELEEKSARGLVDLVILRPVTTDNIILRIMNFFDDLARTKSGKFMREQPERAEAQSAAAATSPAATAAAPAQKPAQAPKAEEKPKSKKHIVVVDDDRNVLKMLKSALEEKYEVTSMANGVLVEKALAVKPADLIILDYEMPIMTGAEVFRRLKANPFYRRIPVCFLTGVSEQEKVSEIMSLRPDNYLLKPIDMKMLMATIENLI